MNKAVGDALKKYESLDVRELEPNDGHVSFYGKAFVIKTKDDDSILVSYTTPVMILHHDGKLQRLWFGWSATTGRHIKTFCGLRKAELDKMELGKSYFRRELVKWGA